jgi:hypothetical protein
VTADIHTFVAGDVRVEREDRKPVATEFVGGSVTSVGLGEGGGGLLPGADPYNPKTPQSIVDPAARREPVGRGRRLRPSWLRARRGKPGGVPLHVPAGGDGEAALAGGVAGPALRLPQRARGAESARLNDCNKGWVPEGVQHVCRL